MASILHSAKTAMLYCGLSKEDYEKISPLIAERNFSFADVFSVAMMIFGGIFLISQLFSKPPILFPYLFLILSGLLLLILGRTLMSRTDRGKMLYRYLQIGVVFAFATILSAQGSNREQPSVSIVVFLALLPLTINDRPLRMAGVVYGAAFAYLICSSQVKAPFAFKADVFNTLTFTTLGMAVYLLISNRNIHEIYLRQQAVESDRLREKMRAAELANAAKSDFLANMSHEIRTPINAMLGMNEIILRESLQARHAVSQENETLHGVFGDICRYAGDIESAGKSLLAIINDILDFSKIEAGKMEIACAPYRLSSVLNDVSNMILFKARAKGLDFRVDVDETIPDVLNGDEVRVRQIITNLLNNAVKYTDQGGVRLSVGAGQGERREGAVLDLVIRVEDTGIGIREEDIGRLFGKFERVDLVRNSTVEGTGLGLAIARNLLDLMGGRIDVESVYGKGSAFTVMLPQTVLALEPVGDFREKFERSMDSAALRKDLFRAPQAHILIVDDTRMNLTVVVGLLKKTEIGIDAVTSGEEAIKLARSIRYDLILMDQRMPVMDGTEALRRIRAQADGANRDTPVICLTADAVSGARERYLAEGFTDYLTKPIDSAALEKMIIKHLPAEKVILQAEDEETRPGEPPEALEDDFAYLRAVGVHPQAGLRYCQNDAALYQTLLREYLDAAAQRLDDLNRYCEVGDWKNYGIAIHALKSSSRTIGAQALSEMSAALEAAADRTDALAIRQDHSRMLAQYRALVEVLAGHITADGADAEEGEVLEFMPE